MGKNEDVIALTIPAHLATVAIKESAAKPDGGWLTLEIQCAHNTPDEVIDAAIKKFESVTIRSHPVLKRMIELFEAAQEAPTVENPADVVLGFGKFQGYTIAGIDAIDRDYIRWLSDKAREPRVRLAATAYLEATSTPRPAAEATTTTTTTGDDDIPF